MPRPASLLLVVALGFALASCGEEDAELLPGGTAREITANLETVQRLADEGDCLGAESAAQQVSEQVEAISGIDERLKRALRNGAARLNEVVARCEEEVESIPEETEPETESAPDGDDGEDEEKEKEKDEEKDEDRDGDREGEAEGDEVEETEPTLPPQSEGEGKGLGNGNGSSGEGGGGPSGGVAPATPAGEGR